MNFKSGVSMNTQTLDYTKLGKRKKTIKIRDFTLFFLSKLRNCQVKH